MSARSGSNVLLAARSLLWVVLMPGIVAGYIPWRFFGFDRSIFDSIDARLVAGLAIFVAGVALLAACVWEFAKRGRGTLSPLDPPSQLVVRGLYRYVRNPMYLAVSVILLGEALAARSFDLVIYWAAFFAVTNLFIIGFEEPDLRRRFGASYAEYTARVGRWIPSGSLKAAETGGETRARRPP
jgi:protein-S-isoprenylcysteine O-methyltransferase Ste14